MTESERLLAAAVSADRDAASEFPGSYYRKAHKARARRLRAKAARIQTGEAHNFDGSCQHPDCRNPQGYQAMCCGHYFPRSRVAMGTDSEPYCREGMGCQTRRSR
jgi:hypothetical protein